MNRKMFWGSYIFSFFVIIVFITLATDSVFAANIITKTVAKTWTITTDSTLTLQGSPYIITQTLYIGKNATLTIEPGVQILFKRKQTIDPPSVSTGYRIMVRGAIIARGTKTRPVLFSSAEAYPKVGDWEGVWFLESSKSALYDQNWNYLSGSILEYVKFEYSSNSAVYGFYASPCIKNCTFQNNASIFDKGDLITVDPKITYNEHAKGGAVYLYRPQSPVLILENKFLLNECLNLGGALMIAETYDLSILIKHNLFKKNHATKNGGAIRLLAASPVLFGNNFTENTASYEGGAIHMSYYSHAVIDSNTFTNNTGSTIGGALFVAHTSNPLITHNLFDSNEILNMGVAVGGGAITLWAHAFPEISENYIHANTAKAGSAIFCYELSAKKPGMASIHNNEIVNNLYYYPGGQGGDAIELVNSTSISITDNNIINPDVKYELLESLQEPYKGIADTVYTPYNYWGKDKMSEIEARIYHKYDDTKLPVVNYVPFYTDSIVNNF